MQTRTENTRLEIRLAAMLLDHVKPKWYNEVDTEKLDMQSCTNCVLGQVYRGYEDTPFPIRGLILDNDGTVGYKQNSSPFSQGNCDEQTRQYGDWWREEVNSRKYYEDAA